MIDFLRTNIQQYLVIPDEVALSSYLQLSNNIIYTHILRDIVNQ